MNDHGLKTSAGMSLSKFLRNISTETTEVAGLDPKNGKLRIITKAEALARIIWRMALGYNDGDKDVPPNLACIAMVFDRLEGKVATNSDTGKKPKSLSSKVGEQAKKRLNRIATGDNDGDGS
jgi:hypothetical protein